MDKGTVAFSARFKAIYALFLCNAIGLAGSSSLVVKHWIDNMYNLSFHTDQTRLVLSQKFAYTLK